MAPKQVWDAFEHCGLICNGKTLRLGAIRSVRLRTQRQWPITPIPGHSVSTGSIKSFHYYAKKDRIDIRFCPSSLFYPYIRMR